MKNILDGDIQYEHVTLKQGWEELTHVTFGVWVRMQNLDYSMNEGTRKMAQYFGFSRERFATILKELERKGYIDIDRPAKKFEKIQVILKRHAVIYGKNTFVKLSKVREMEFEDYSARFNHFDKGIPTHITEV